MSHEELQELLAGYALDALDAADRAEVEAHLATCATCPADLDRLRDTAGLIGLEAPPVPPRPALRARILESIQEDVAPGGLSRKGELVRPDPAFWRRFATAGGLAAAAAIVGLFMHAAGLATRMRTIESELFAERERARFLAAPETQVVVLAGTPDAPQARAKLAYDPKSGEAVLFGYDLPQPPRGKAYQLWFIAGGKPLPGRVFAPEANGSGWWSENVPPAGRDAAVFAVTLEPASGVQAPTGPMVLKGVARS